MPWVLLAIAIATGLMIWMLVGREKQRMTWKEQNLCPVCGYDMRASPDRCPECGAKARLGLPLEIALDMPVLNGDWPNNPIKPRVPETTEEPVLLYDTADGMMAGVLGEQLQVRGVMARVRSGRPVVTAGGVVRHHVYWKVVVWSGDLERAIAITTRFKVRQTDDQPVEDQKIS